MNPMITGHPLTLRRDELGPDGIFGTLHVPWQGAGLRDALVLQTMEDDWRFNRRRVSAIPAGLYLLRRTIFHRHNLETFEVTGVPNRDRILIHPGNTEEDVEGCIGLGLRRGPLWVHDEDDPAHPRVEKRAVLDSKPAFAKFMEWMRAVDAAPLHLEWMPGLSPEAVI
jgi:hypothetical protein